MKLKKEFEELKKKFPEYSSYILFADLVKGKGYSKEVIESLFDLFVESSDYSKSDLPDLVHNLFKLSENVSDSHTLQGGQIDSKAFILESED
jgi:hypothetical protein